MAAQQSPSISQKWQRWSQYWYVKDNNHPRARYNNDRKSYLDAFCLDDEDRENIQEAGMAAFIRLEKRLLRKARFDHYQQHGNQHCAKLFTNLTSSKPASSPELLFVAIDFEGMQKKGVTECGLAIFDPNQLSSGIRGTNIATSCRRRRKYLFQEWMRITSTQLPSVLFNILSTRSNQKIILVGHNIQNEIDAMDKLGIPLEDLPDVIGVIDTYFLASTVLGRCGSLQSLLDVLEIAYLPDTFHCAGNDAYYTMQALLALLVVKARGNRHSPICRIEEIAWCEMPQRPPSTHQKSIECSDDSTDALDDYGGFEDIFGL